MSVWDSIDTDGLRDDVAGHLADGIESLLDGAREDVEQFALAIVRDQLEARLTGRDDLTDDLDDQLALLAEVNRVRAIHDGWATVGKVAQAVLAAAVSGAVAGLLGGARG